MPRFRGRTLEKVRSVLWGFIELRFHSDPAQGADPASGAERTSSSKKFCSLHMEKFHTLRGRPSFLFTHTKTAVPDPACGVEPYKFGGAQKAGQTPQSGQVAFTLRGKRRGLTPHVGFDPAIGALCKHGNYPDFIKHMRLEELKWENQGKAKQVIKSLSRLSRVTGKLIGDLNRRLEGESRR